MIFGFLIFAVNNTLKERMSSKTIVAIVLALLAIVLLYKYGSSMSLMFLTMM